MLVELSPMGPIVSYLWSFLTNLLTGRIQLTLSVGTLLAAAFFVASAAWLYIRYKFLNIYERLHDYEDKPQNSSYIAQEDPKSGFSSYLGEFLSAIKIFGYLDKPVFHELTRSMKTQRLDKGELFALDNSSGFSIVVEGSVNVYSKMSDGGFYDGKEELQDTLLLNGEKFQLINYVKTGNPLSSLVSILSLFTTTVASTPDQTVFRVRQENNSHHNSLQIYPDFYSFDLNSPKSPQSPIEEAFHLHEGDATEDIDPPLPDLMAQAQTDCVIATIPASSFQKLTQKWPRAASHIVQVVLTRLYRVTFQTAHNYLGLTPEIFDTEKRINDAVDSMLPDYLSTGIMSPSFTMSSSFQSSSNMSDTEIMTSSSSLKKPTNNFHSRHVVLDSRNIHHPGDLLSSVPISRTGIVAPATFSAEEETEDTAIRIAVVENLFLFLGIEDRSLPYSASSTSSLNHDIRSFRSRSNSTLRSFSRRNSVIEEPLDYEQAQREFAQEIKFMFITKGTTVVHQNKPNKGLYYVISGALDVFYNEKTIYTGDKEKHLYTATRGKIAGYLASLVGHKSLVSVTASENSYVAFLPQATINALCEKYFTIHLSIAEKLVKSISKVLLDMDFAVEWVQAKAGHSVYTQDASATGIYLVLSGRFREIRKVDSEIKTLGEHGQGSSLGEVEVLTASKRHSSLIAVRESEAARIPRYLFEILALRNPSIMIKISRIVAQKVSGQLDPGFNSFPNYKTITILPTRYGLPVTEFAEKLVAALSRMKSVIALNQASILSHLGKHAFDKLSKLKQSGYFSDLEESHDIVIYVTDTPVNSNWTHTCITQGDCILLLADASSNPEIGDYERLLLKAKTSARTELVLLHTDRVVIPGSTQAWLKNRLWVDNHHHVQFLVPREIKPVKIEKPLLHSWRSRVGIITSDLVERYKGKTSYASIDYHKNDFSRLARILSGQAIGLVLGGGGARGISHIGVIQTLEDEGIPIDLIGGTSIGAFIGGLYAKEYDMVPIYGRAKKFSGRVASVWRTLSDLTYPLVSYTTGHEFNRGVWKAFGDSRIEDFWIRYFCNSTNITTSEMEYHTSGYAWRFIRASMSLCGLVPPMVDHKGNMLLDGGYVDNLPVDEMKRQGANIIFAVDVGSVDDRTLMTYGDTLSGVLALINRYNPFSRSPVVPSMADIQLRLAYVGSVGALERAKSAPGVIYMRPPVDKYGTLAFGRFNEIYETGMKFAKRELTTLKKEGRLRVLELEPVKSVKVARQRRNSI